MQQSLQLKNHWHFQARNWIGFNRNIMLLADSVITKSYCIYLWLASVSTEWVLRHVVCIGVQVEADSGFEERNKTRENVIFELFFPRLFIPKPRFAIVSSTLHTYYMFDLLHSNVTDCLMCTQQHPSVACFDLYRLELTRQKLGFR